MNREGPPEKIPKSISFKEATEIAIKNTIDTENRRKEANEKEYQEYLASNTLDLYAVYLHLHGGGDYSYSSKNVIAIFEDKNMTIEYVEKIANDRKNYNIKRLKELFKKTKPSLIKQTKIKDLENIEFRWNNLDEYKPYLNNEYFRDYQSYSIEHFDLNEKYTIEQISDRIFIYDKYGVESEHFDIIYHKE